MAVRSWARIFALGRPARRRSRPPERPTAPRPRHGLSEWKPMVDLLSPLRPSASALAQGSAGLRSSGNRCKTRASPPLEAQAVAYPTLSETGIGTYRELSLGGIVSDDQDKPHATPVSKSPVMPSSSIRRWTNLLAQRQSPRAGKQASSKDPLETVVSAVGGSAELAKLAEFAQGPSPEMKKAMEGVLSGIGSRSQTEPARPASLPNDTFVGRFLTTLGGGFLTGSPTISAAIALKQDNPNWYVISALVIGCWLVGGFLMAAGLRWPKWKPNHEVLARSLGVVSNSLLAWAVFLSLICAGPAILIGLLASRGNNVSAYTRSELDAAVSDAQHRLQAQNDEAVRKMQAALVDANNLRHQLAEHQSPTPGQGYPQAFGTTCVMNFISNASGFWARLPKGTAILVTGTKDNDQLAKNLFATLSFGGSEQRGLDRNTGRAIFGLPNKAIDLDAPSLTLTDQRGIIIHGNDPEDALRLTWNNMFVVRHTSTVPDGLAEYYKVLSIVWIEIGPGSPWANPALCPAI